MLDTAHGKPASGLQIDLYRITEVSGESVRTQVTRRVTNADGRTDAPLLTGTGLERGVYELVFHIGAYFASTGMTSEHTPFLDEVPVRFGIDDEHAAYHVPLLASPYGYSTYRGS